MQTAREGPLISRRSSPAGPRRHDRSNDISVPLRSPPSTDNKKGPVSRAHFVPSPRLRRALFLELHDDVYRGADAHGDIDGLRLVAGARDGNRVRAGICDDSAWVCGEVLARAEVLVVDVDGRVSRRDLEPHARAVARGARKGLGPGVHPLFGHPLAIAPSVVTRRALRIDT